MKYEITSLNTKKTLAESLKKIMKKKSFSKITVSEIIEDCGVNRKTFYYHFEDIYALLKWVLASESVEVLKHMDLIEDYEEALIFVMDYVEKNEYIIQCAYDSIGRDEMSRLFYADFIQLIFLLVDTVEKEMGKQLDPDYKAFLCKFYTEALAGVLIDWIKHRETRNRKQVIEYVTKTLQDSLRGIMQG